MKKMYYFFLLILLTDLITVSAQEWIRPPSFTILTNGTGTVQSVASGRYLGGGPITSMGTLFLDDGALNATYDTRYLGIAAQAVDSAKLDGFLGSYYLNGTGFNALNLTSGSIPIGRYNFGLFNNTHTLSCSNITGSNQNLCSLTQNPGTVTSITAGLDLNGGTITSSGTIDLNETKLNLTYLLLHGTADNSNQLVSQGAQYWLNITGFNALNLTTGTLLNARLNSSYVVTQNSTGGINNAQLSCANVTGSNQNLCSLTQNSGTVTSITAGLDLNGGVITTSGTIDVNETKLNLTYLLLHGTADNSAQLAGQNSIYYLNKSGFDASNITSGTIVQARIPDQSNKLTLDAGNITTGTLANARLPTNIPQTGVTNNFTVLNQFTTINASQMNMSTLNVIQFVQNIQISNITIGQAVYITGSNGTTLIPQVGLANASQQLSASVFGIAIANINSGSSGLIQTQGIITNLNTSAFTTGSTLYLSATQNGNLTSTPPTSLNFQAPIGTVLLSNGTIGQILLTNFESQTNTSLSQIQTGADTRYAITSASNTFTGSWNFFSNINASTINATIGNYTSYLFAAELIGDGNNITDLNANNLNTGSIPIARYNFGLFNNTHTLACQNITGATSNLCTIAGTVTGVANGTYLSGGNITATGILSLNDGALNTSLDRRYLMQNSTFKTPAFGFDSGRNASTNQPTMVIATVQINVTGSVTVSQLGQALFQVSSDNATWMTVAQWENGLSSGITESIPQAHANTIIVPSTWYYRINRTFVSGTPVFTLLNITEMTI